MRWWRYIESNRMPVRYTRRLSSLHTFRVCEYVWWTVLQVNETIPQCEYHYERNERNQIL